MSLLQTLPQASRTFHRGTPTDEEISRARVDAEGSHAEVEAAKEHSSKVTDGLDTFMLKPVGIKCQALLEHMTKFRKRTVKKRKNSKPSMHLDIDVNETQVSILNPTLNDTAEGSIIEGVGGKGARFKLSKRRLDNLGYINSHCGIQNGEKRMDRLKSQLELTESLAKVKRAAIWEGLQRRIPTPK